ncbi:MAG: mhpE [Paenibacillus sp.]|nr:mhpE [Paenibacillus sp.]
MGTKRFVQVLDATMRDGCHPLLHQYTAETLSFLASTLDQAGTPYLEVSHGDGVGGSSLHFGKSLLLDAEAIGTARASARKARITALLLPGVGRLTDLETAKLAGAQVVRVATLATEADLAQRYIKAAHALELEAFGFLMLSSTASPEQLLEQGKKLESYGASAVYIVDSAGAMTIDEVRAKVSLLRQHLSTRIGFHGHNNLGLAVGNTLIAVEEGADLVDGCLAGFGAGAGNAPTEVLVAALHKMGYETGIDASILLQAADVMLLKVMPRPQYIEKGALSLGIMGIRGNSLFTTLPLLGKYGADVRDLFSSLVIRGNSASDIERSADGAIEERTKNMNPSPSSPQQASGIPFH